MAAEKIVTESALSALASDAKNAILDVYPTESVEASEIATFNTDIELPLKNIKCTIVASGGGGTPSTPIPIVGYSELNLVHCGSNFLDISHLANKRFDGTASVNNVITENKIPIKGGIEYIWHTALSDVSGRYIEFYDSNDTYISEVSLYGLADRAFTAPNNATSYRAMWYYGSGISPSDITEDYINVGSTATPYAPYNGTPYLVQFGQTVYGGVYDKSGRLTITWGYKDLGTCSWYLRNATATRQAWNTQDFIGIIKSPASLSTPYNALCDSFVGVDYNGTWLPGTFANSSTSDDTIAFCSNPNEFADADAFKASVNGVIFAYELATPQTVQLTPTQVQAILGDNNVFCDTGSTAVVYRESIQKYVNDHGATRTDVAGTLTAGSTSITLSSTAITTSSTIEVFTDPEVPYNSLTVTNGQTVLTFDAQANNVSVKVRVT